MRFDLDQLSRHLGRPIRSRSPLANQKKIKRRKNNKDKVKKKNKNIGKE
jgi:hypothetical protein